MNTIKKRIDELTKQELNDGDYQLDNIWYCGKCRTPKTVYIQPPSVGAMPFTYGYKPIPCACEQGKAKQTAETLHQAGQAVSTRENRLKGFADSRYTQYTFEQNTKKNDKNVASAMRYVDKFPEMLKKNIGIMYYGDVGTGKTFLAGCIANALLDKGYSVVMTNFALILAQMQDIKFDKLQFLKNIAKCDLLVIDDFGIERKTDFAMENMFSVIDTRYRSNKPLIVTTNIDTKAINQSNDLNLQRIHDRMKELCTPLCVNNRNMRDESAQNRQVNFQQLVTNN